jgi:cobalt-zinc-cadmium efflux system protein
MLSDVAALALSFFAARLSLRPPTPQRTYGYYRTEILAALVNGAALIAIALFIAVEAFERLQHPPAVDSVPMLAIASGGLLINLIGLSVLHGGHTDNLNVRGAFLHVFTDLLGSIGAIISGLLIWRFGWRFADPLASMVIAILVVISAWSLLKQSVSIIMESAPEHIDVEAIRTALCEVEGVNTVHDLHVWSITTGMVCLSGHAVITEQTDQQQVLAQLNAILRDRFSIQHTTLQIEQCSAQGTDADPCCTHCDC